MLCAGLLAVQTACHTFLPLQESVPDRGEIIGVVLNDQGRLLMGERLGESVDRVDGVLVEQNETSIVLNVTRTRSLRGSHTVWTGEPVTIPKVGVRGFQERQYSRGKTAMLVVGLILGIAAVGSLITLAAGGFGRGDDPGPGPDPQ